LKSVRLADPALGAADAASKKEEVVKKTKEGDQERRY